MKPHGSDGTKYHFSAGNVAFGVYGFSEGDNVIFTPREGSPSPVADGIRKAPTRSEIAGAQALLSALSDL